MCSQNCVSVATPYAVFFFNGQMKIFLKRSITANVIFVVTACGGGGGGDSAPDSSYGAGQTYSYLQQGGLNWSSPSNVAYIFAQPLQPTLEPDANSYCSQSTSTNGGPAVPTNFNKQTGWRIPTYAEMQSLHADLQSPAGWPNVNLWVEGLNKNRYLFDVEVYARHFNLVTGLISYPAAYEKASVTCVKPI